ncbi:MAG: glycosyltransferase family 39 protein, partial [Planctomycetes bacterium]|nr:glycosyltransferase family 39 protein [Planctomycetota bacterium]
ESADGARGGRLDSLWVGLVALALYVALGQDTLYGVDAWNDLRLLAGGDVRSAVHVLYRPLAAWFADLGGVFGWSLHESVRMLSAVGAALGVAFMHAASRRLLVAPSAAFVQGIWIAVLPGIWFYGTVAERHGPFFAFAGVACYVTACWIRSGRTVWTLGFALACGLAYAAHSTGVLLCGMLVPLYAMERHRAGRPWLRDSLVALLGSAVAVFAVSRLAFLAGQLTEATGNLQILGEYAGVALQHVDHWPNVAWHEFLLPLMPVSLVWLGRVRGPDGLCVTTTLAVGVAVYLMFSILILAGFDAIEHFDERGAYALPLAWPLTRVSAAVLGRRLALVGIGLSSVIAVAQILVHDTHRDQWTRPEAELLRQVEPGRPPYLLPAVRPDFELLFVEFPEFRPWFPEPGRDGDYIDLFHAVHAEDHDGGKAIAAILPNLLRAIVTTGRPVLISERAVRFLETSEHRDVSVLGPEFLAELRRAFEFREVGDATHRYYRLEPR